MGHVRTVQAARLAAATLTTTGLVITAVAVLSTSPAAGQEPCPIPTEPAAFEMEYIDETRAGGEPIIVTHPDGTLLWGSHAGTTHFYGPAAPDPQTAAFLENYEGQTYQYWSDDNGATWTFSPRTPINADPTSGLPNSGFSDPEFAIDSAGNVFISEINLANIAFSKSSDSGRTWTLQNVAGITLTDRQWMEADEEDVLWFVGNTFGGGSPDAGEPVTASLDNRLYKSVDGGQTFSEGQSMGGQQSSEIVIDKNTGALYQIHEYNEDLGDQTIGMRVFANARNEAPPNVTFTDHLIADEHYDVSSIGPTPAVDADGNLYVVWDEDGNGREQGIWYSASQDGGVSWSTPVRINEGPEFAFWPWVAVGEAGNVSVAWLEHETPIESGDPEQADAGWNVMVALTQTGLGCDGSDVPGFQVTQATSEPIHTGTVCNGGTVCQAELVDRRLGDYFANTVAADGMTVVAVSDTRQGGSVALPLAVRQVSGPDLRAPGGATSPSDDSAVPAPSPDQGTGLPATGGGLAMVGFGLAALAATQRKRLK